jgi:hypothetical protein
MPVKFKLGFTIDAKTLFGIMSQFLPVQDLVVEEIVEREPEPTIRFDKRFDLPKPKPKRATRSGYAMNLHKGANAIMMAVMSDGEQHLGSDCFPALRAAGYSTNGLYGKFERLKKHGVLFAPVKGKWQITPKGKQLWEKQEPVHDRVA